MTRHLVVLLLAFGCVLMNVRFGWSQCACASSLSADLNQTTGDWHRDALADTSRVVRLLNQSARSFCAKNDDRGYSPCGASPLVGRDAPCSIRVSVGVAHFATLCCPADPDRDCHRAVLFALHRLSRGQGVPGRATEVGKGRGEDGRVS